MVGPLQEGPELPPPRRADIHPGEINTGRRSTGMRGKRWRQSFRLFISFKRISGPGVVIVWM